MPKLTEFDLQVMKQFEEREKKILSPNAAFSNDGKPYIKKHATDKQSYCCPR